jgi:arabinofuranan 3-O-arabinosyltransferase
MLLAFVLLVVASLVALRIRVVLRRRRRDLGPDAVADEAMWPVVLVLVSLSAAPFLLHEHGWYVGDTQFFFAWNPHRALTEAMSIWQTRADLGGTTPGTVFLPNAYLTALRGLGAPAWLAQRLWFATVLAGGSIGTAYVARFFAPRTRIAALVAGVSFIAAPFTVAYFFPTWLFVSAALCPWLALSALRGTTTTAGWRWAALPALLVAAFIFNPPAIFFAALPAVAALVYVRASGWVRWRAIARWLGRVAIFAIPALAPYVVTSWFQLGTSRITLASSESIDAIAQSSSWSESLRGLGGWLTYWNPTGRLVLPYVHPYLTNWLVVVLTFAPVVAAFVVVAVVPKRARLLFGAVLVACAALMVGAFAPHALPPLSWALANFYRAVPASYAFRNVYKAGAGLVLATAVLLAFGAEWVVRRWRSPRVRAGAAAAGALVLIATSLPLWNGAILRGNQRLDGNVPSYWRDAMHWLDAQPGDGRVMIAPTSNEAQYRWGSTNDGDMFSSFLARPAVLGGAFPASSGDAGNLVQALSAYLSSGLYTPGTLAPIARRLGMSYLVIRNDLDWQRTGDTRPANLASLRADPGLERVASFGRPGENTTSPDDDTPAAALERRLAPVEVFRVLRRDAPGGDGPARAVSDAPALLVSGDGEAWPELADAQLLQRLGPVRYTGRIDTSTLRAQLALGATLAITDTNRRRSVAYGVQPETLPASATDRVGDLFGRPGSQTVVTYGDATSIQEIGPPRLFTTGVSHGAWAAFDGDPSTTWLTGIGTPPLGERIEVRLRRPHLVSSIRVQGAAAPGTRLVLQVQVSFDKGKPIDLVLGPDNVGAATFSPREVRRFSVSVRRVTPGGGAYGLAEVSVDGLDLAQRVQVPNDVARVARADPAIARSLASTPTSYLFERGRGLSQDSEPTLRRRFDVAATRVFAGSGVLQIDSHVPDAAVTRLVAPSSACRKDLVQIDGSPVGVTLEGTVADLRAGVAVPVTFCGTVVLRTGWHELAAAPGVPLNVVRMSALGGRQPVEAPAAVANTTSRTETSLDARVSGTAPAWLISGQAMSSHWGARSDGHGLGPTVELDTQAAWRVPAGAARDVAASFSVQGPYRITLWLSFLAMGAAYLVIVVDPKTPACRLRSSAPVHRRAWLIALEVIAVLFAFGVGGVLQAAVVIAAIVAFRRRWVPPSVVVLAGAALVVLTAATVVPPLGPALRPVDPAWPLRRDTAHVLALQAAVLLVVGLVGFARARFAPRADRSR